MIVFLVGMPGVGKSFWLKKLKAHYRCKGTDLDLYIEIKQQAKISELFEKGEAHFRTVEAQALRSLVNQVKDEELHFISTGGGTPCFNENMDFMLQNGLVFYLKAPAKFIKSRLSQSKVVRPMFLNIPDEERIQFIESLLEKRSIFYEQSPYIVDAVSLRLSTFVEFLEQKNNYK